ncbi:HIT domain-containing protein [Microcoleus sp. herbarium5]|uniref:HIT domain-containing protein n=1 Tax=Microcoleus sp. herbarium5 TaxID=3055434 RepID=UPI002FD034E6
MHDNLKAFVNKFRIDELNICDSNFWIWSLRPSQCTLASGILSLKRYEEEFSKITAEESHDLKEILLTIETALKKSFKYDKINYLMLMMVDPHLHFHVIPRYSQETSFSSKSWIDSGWPSLPDLSSNGPEHPVLLYEIRDRIISFLPS